MLFEILSMNNNSVYWTIAKSPLVMEKIFLFRSNFLFSMQSITQISFDAANYVEKRLIVSCYHCSIITDTISD